MSFIVFDTEDNSKELMEAGLSGFDKKVTQIAAIARNGDRFYSPGNIPEFLRWLKLRKEKYLYAHNVQYDLGNLFGDEIDCLDSTLVGGRMIKATWGPKEFRDSYNIYVMSVKELGRAFGLEKLETESMAYDKDYVFRDCEIIHAGLCYAWEFVESMGLTVLPTTAGGICFAIWKHCLNGTNCHDSLELSREAYYGGRVELFKRRSESNFVAYTDINSLYPFALQREFPGVLEDCGNNLAPYGIARVTVDMPKLDIAVLPWRNPVDGRILYPWGKFTGTWTIAEISEAVNSGGKVLRVHQCYGTQETMTPYAQAMQQFYKARLMAQSGAEKEFFKRMMNAFYGRLGTRGVIGRTVLRTDKTENKGTPFGSKVLVEYELPLAEETNWSHAAYVTAYGRLELLKYLRKVGAGNLIYCDTDSCIFDVPSPLFNMQFAQPPKPGTQTCCRLAIPFETGKELGEMKLEGWESGCECWAPKMYHTGKTWKAKGVPKRLAKQFIETGKASFDLPFKYREAVAFFDRDNAKKLSVWRRVEKEVRSGYDRKDLIGNRFYPCKVDAVLPD